MTGGTSTVMTGGMSTVMVNSVLSTVTVGGVPGIVVLDGRTVLREVWKGCRRDCMCIHLDGKVGRYG